MILDFLKDIIHMLNLNRYTKLKFLAVQLKTNELSSCDLGKFG